MADEQQAAEQAAIESAVDWTALATVKELPGAPQTTEETRQLIRRCLVPKALTTYNSLLDCSDVKTRRLAARDIMEMEGVAKPAAASAQTLQLNFPAEYLKTAFGGVAELLKVVTSNAQSKTAVPAPEST